MNEPKAFDINGVKLEGIAISDAIIENETGMDKLPAESYFNLSYSFRPGLNLDQKKIRLIFSCKVDAFDKTDNKLDIKGKFEIVFYFKIEELETMIMQEENDFQIDVALLSELGNIAYSSSRGIIYTKCQGTILKKVILPVLSAASLVEMLQPKKG